MSKPEPYFRGARDILREDCASPNVEQQLWRSMNLERLANTLLEKTDISSWGKDQATIEIATEMAKALSKIHLADHFARLMAAAVAVNAKPDGRHEREMVSLFEELSTPSIFSDSDHLKAIAQDCVTALSYVQAYYKIKAENPSRAKVAQPGSPGYNLKSAATARLFQGALFDDPDNLIDSFAIIAECASSGSAERLAAIIGLLRYPQYASFLDGADAEAYIEILAPIGSATRDEAEEWLKVGATIPLKDVLGQIRNREEISCSPSYAKEKFKQ
ncbi:MAG: hypothetical protein PHW76_05990 [Alphaproteobacteria bacterium]|nr:hypothetical protein [Alphaproteobacteria bacterium]